MSFICELYLCIIITEVGSFVLAEVVPARSLKSLTFFYFYVPS